VAGPIKIAILADARQAQAAFLKVAGGADSMGAKVARTGSRLTRSLTLPIVAIGAASVKMSTDFNTAMTKVQTQAGASAQDVQILSKQVLDLAAHTQQGPVELADALFHLKSVGLDNAKAMKALAESSKLAAVGGADLEDTTNALAGAWRSGIKGARDFHQTVGTLNAIVGAGNQTMQDLTAAMGTGFLPSARSFGISLKSVGSALALMTDEGIPAQVAATRLRMSFSLLGAPSNKAAEQLASIGLESDALAKKMRQGGPHGGLVGAIGLLKDHLSELNKTEQATLISKAFGGGRSSSAILTLLNNYDVLVRKQKQIEHTSADVGKAIAKQAQTPQAQFKLLESTVEVLAIKIGNVLLPDVVKVADALNGFFTAVSKLPAPVKDVGGGLALVSAGLGPIILLSGSLIRSVTAISEAMTALGSASIGTRVGLAGVSIAENKLRFGAAIAGMAALTASTQTSNEALSDLLQVAGGAAAGFAAGGPVGAAIGAGAGVFTILAKNITSAGHAAKFSRADFSKLADTFDSLNGSVTADTRKLIENQLARTGELKTLANYGISSRTAVNAILGEGQARRVVEAATRSQTAAIADQKRQIALLTAANVADEKAGTLSPKAQAARKQQIDAYKEQIAQERAGIDAIRQAIPQYRKEHRAALQRAADLADYSGKLKGLPKVVRTTINAGNVVATKKSVATLAKLYNLTPKQIKTVISAVNADFSVKQIQKVEKALTDVSKVRPNLSGYKTVLSSQLDQAGGIARTGGTQIGNALGAGLNSAVQGWSGSIARTSADLVSNAIRAARKAADAHSPSRKMIQLGEDMGIGLAQGLDKSRMRAIFAAGETVKAAIDKMTAYIKTQDQKLKSLLSAKSQFTQGFQTFATSAFGADFGTDVNGNPIAPTAAAIIAFQQQQRDQAALVKQDVRRLIHMGLSPALLKQLQAAGASGFAEIQALAAASPSQIKQFNALNRQTTKDLNLAGVSASDRIFGDRIKNERKSLNELERIRRELHELRTSNGNELVIRDVNGEVIIRAIKKAQRKKGKKSPV
jgi:TP901 family phage tail tape measure protein